ncbi:BTB/POZ domain-containing protein KCTD19 isoform X1 [Sceloporus undulatus]|uniref:BTB/POZ domain-containing protein KCTD19 isoform X1 n=1 Tax=Sceloporus undulatus TaxID=8520 RepID=UPI001C4B17F3|nr:BTB/POZ domain-containing protein KCTD19 isoform X1 [Sceloporus undulatus]
MHLGLPTLLQTLDNLKEGKHNLRIRPADIPIAERASMNYWRTRKCISKPSEFPLKSPAFTGLHEKAPLGLMDTPLLDTEEEVHYCFLPLDMAEKHPSLVSDDNLLWLSDNAVLIECESSTFRFIANYLRSEKMLLPDDFSRMEALETEAEALGIPEVMEAVRICKAHLGVCSEETLDLQGCAKSPAEKPPEAMKKGLPLPLYPMVLGLLVKYPDSALGQLHMEGTLDGDKLYISGNGVLFQHVMNWLGTCRLPLIRSISELPELCAYLDHMDVTYEPMKEALKIYLKQQTSTDTVGKGANWVADVAVFSPLHIVKVYAGSHWYATYLQTLLKCPELLSNRRKAIWMACGQSLLIHGDGEMFRHILNFLRLGRLLLPSDFKEWALLCQEVAEYQIPSLLEALHQLDSCRLSVQQQEAPREAFPVQSLEISEKEQESGEDPQKLLHIAVASNWSVRREAPDPNANAKESGRGMRIAPAKGVKRRSPFSEGLANPFSPRRPESPPRKRGARGSGARRSENKDTPIQKLISLVQGWDMVSCRRCQPQLPTPGPPPPPSLPLVSGGLRAEKEAEKRASCNQPLASSFEVSSPGPSQNGFLIQPVPPKAGQPTLGTLPPERWLGKTGGDGTPEEVRHTGGKVASKERETGPFPELTSHPISHKPQGHTGFILKVDHPPVVACDGSCTSHEGSILYSTSLGGLNLAGALADPASSEIVFLSFPLSQEEIFYARKCHRFLTDIILESIRQKDPKGTTARIELLVQRLWFSLPFAWKYSSCIDLLVKRGYFKSLSHFVIEKYLQNSE